MNAALRRLAILSLEDTIIFEKEREVDEVGVGGVERQHGAEQSEDAGGSGGLRGPDANDASDANEAVWR